MTNEKLPARFSVCGYALRFKYLKITTRFMRWALPVIMKKTVLILIILISGLGFAQEETPFYEQIAFDKYRSEIIDSFPVKKKVKVYKYVFDFQPTLFWFSTPSCLSNIVRKSNEQFQPIKDYIDSQRNFDSNRFELDLSDLDKKQFKIKKSGRGNYPKLFISPPYKENGNDERIFVNIYEKHSERKEIIYHLEFDKSGMIQDWCYSISETIILH